MCVDPLPSRELSRLLLALILGEPLTRDEGQALALEVRRLVRTVREAAARGSWRDRESR